MPTDTDTDMSGLRVLVADDDIVFLEILSEVLKSSGFEVVSAETGLDALKYYKQHSPHLVLLDVVMPGLDGFQVCEAIREIPGGRDVPVIMVSGRESLAGIYEALRVGATEVIPKPINWASIGSRIRYIARIAHSQSKTCERQAQFGLHGGVMPETILRLGAEGVVIDAMCQLEGHNADDARDSFLGTDEGSLGIEASIGNSVRDLFPFEVADELDLHLTRLLETGNYQSFQYLRDDEDVSQTINVRMLPSADNESIVIFSDISEQTSASELSFRSLLYDKLTGLQNKAFFLENLRQAMADATQYRTGLAVLCIDLDHFQRVNGRFSDEVGDQLLIEYAERLRALTQSGNLLARGINPHSFADDAVNTGNEFILLIGGLKNTVTEAAVMASKILAQTARPFDAGKEASIQLTASIGVACYPQDGEFANQLLLAADSAMKTAKARGRNQYRLSSPIEDTDAHAALGEYALVESVAEGEGAAKITHPCFQIHYLLDDQGQLQDILPVVHWRDPEQTPWQFLQGLADDSVPEQSLLPGARELYADKPIDNLLTMRLNLCVSLGQFLRLNLVALVKRLHAASGFEPELIELMVPEVVLANNLEHSTGVVTALRELGVKIIIDRFDGQSLSLDALAVLQCDGIHLHPQRLSTMAAGDPRQQKIEAIARLWSVRLMGTSPQNDLKEMKHLRSLGCTRIAGSCQSSVLPADQFAGLRETAERCLSA